MLDTLAGKKIKAPLGFIADKLLQRRITPNQVTVTALILGLLAAVFYWFDLIVIAVILLWLSGLCDALDGVMARAGRQISATGTLLDIFFDRVVELSLIIAIALKYPESHLALVFLTSAIVLSMTVFLTSGTLLQNTGIKSFRYQSGLIERTEGFILFTLMLILPNWLILITVIYSLLVLITAIQRLIIAVKELSVDAKK